MGKRYLIDTNVIIGYLDNKLPDAAMKTIGYIIDDTPNISVISKIELLRFNTSESNYRILEDFVDESIVLGLNDEIIEHTIVICKASKIKLPDAIIAATAVTYNCCLVTRNTVDFKNIAGIEFLNPWDLEEHQ